MHAIAVLGYLEKLKLGLGLAFGAHFLHDFFHENAPYLILYQWAKFQCHSSVSSVLQGPKSPEKLTPPNREPP